MSHISIAGTMHPRFEQILSSDALAFVTELHELFAGTRSDLLAYRMVNRTHFTNGRRPTFLKSTSHIREDASWFVAGPGLLILVKRFTQLPLKIHPLLSCALADGTWWKNTCSL